MRGLEIIETNPQNLVTKSNMLIEASYKLGVVEQKIILCLASNIQPSDSDFKTYTLSIKEFTRLLGLEGTPKYTELRQITQELMRKVFEVRVGNKVIQVAWLSYVAYNETEGTIDIRFDPFLRPYLLQLKKEFTSYKLENIVKLRSSYAIRIYELLKQYEKIQERTFQVCDLRKILGIENVYPAYGNFKQRVLIPAQKELKKKTDISFEIEEIKAGRKVDKVRFRIISGAPLFEENLEEFHESRTFFVQAKKLALQMGVQLTDEILTNWEKHGRDKVISLLKKIQERTDIDNPIGYITAMLKHNNNYTEKNLMVTHLVSCFRKSKGVIPYWFVKEASIDELQKHFQMNVKEAEVQFEKLKSTLKELLNIEEQEFEHLEEDILSKKKKSLENRLKKYKKN
jgi:plasmid replication initiation protein